MQDIQRIIIYDFGAQYTQLIARRVRDLNVFCEVVPHTLPMDELKSKNPTGIILSGGPSSVLDDGAPMIDPALYSLTVPVLSICYGMQLTAFLLGGKVERAPQREYGRIDVQMDTSSALFFGLPASSECWMSHTYHVYEAPSGFHSIAHSDNCAFCAMENTATRIYCVQFHPEVTHSTFGQNIIENFLVRICGCRGDWMMSAFIEDAVKSIREQVGAGRVLLGLSGGVDSSVCAALLSRAIGERLTCVYVDHGFMRKDETEQVKDVFTHLFPVNLVAVDARKRFLDKVAGVSDPETKRKIIGNEFIEVFNDEASKLGAGHYLAQGTIYPDVIESGSVSGSAVIKSHHNVGGLPIDLKFAGLVEPLRMLFKDEVRRLGEELGMPHEMVWRQPFPGPGLSIRIIGDITEEKLTIVRESDAILREEVARDGLDKDINQFFTVLTGIRSVGVMGDERTYDYTVAIRAVTTDDFMTVDWARLPCELLARVSGRIVNEVAYVNRVVYDITTKPPASIEWE